MRSLESMQPEPWPAVATGTPALPAETDVVIIGAGIMGCAAAYYLAKAGVRVVLLDKSRINAQQSSRAWGFVRQQARDPDEVALARGSLAIWRGLEQELQSDLQWRAGGCLFTARDDAEMAGLEAWLDVARQHELDTRLVDGREVRSLVPGLELATPGGLYTPGDGQAEPRLVAPAYARRARELGAVVLEGCGVVAIERTGGRIDGVITERGPLRAPTVICCAGATSSRILRSLGIELPQHEVRGTVARTSAGPAASPLSFVGGGIGWRQRSDGSFNIAEELEVDVEITLGHLRGMQWYLGSLWDHRSSFRFRLGAALLDDLRQRLPGSEARRNGPLIHLRDPELVPRASRLRGSLAALHRTLPAQRDTRIVESWAGAIDVLPDGIPVLDAPAEVPGLLVATGYCGHGFAMGPITGRVLADWITTGEPGYDLRPLRLSRYRERDVKPAYSMY